MQYKFDEKFGERHIEDFTNIFYNHFKKYPNDRYIFNLEKIEWISNQGLLLFASLVKYLYNKNVSFKIIFPQLDERTDFRKIQQIAELWYVWKISKIITNKEDWKDYFGFSNSKLEFSSTYLDEFIKKFDIKVGHNIFNRLGITPFIELNHIEKYEDSKVIEIINPIYQLNKVISEELKKNGNDHPFISKTISYIITRELYENFLDHFGKSIFETKNNWCFFSIALRKKLKNNYQDVLKKNFIEEELDETKSFFYNNNKFKNESLIEFSFIDFGQGIVESLREVYIKQNKTQNPSGADILEFAFKHFSSSNPIKKINNSNYYIPRGLFDVVSIVKRYQGLIIVRSNNSRIIYNFSNPDGGELISKKEIRHFEGTFITIYIPALENKSFDLSVIKPIEPIDYNKEFSLKFISLNKIFNTVKKSDNRKDYSLLVKLLEEELRNNSDKSQINIVSFLGCTDENFIQKSIFLFLTDYNINLNNNLIVIHPPEKVILESVKTDLNNLTEIEKNFKIHPIPFLYDIKDTVNNGIIWIGLDNEEDKKKLNDFIYENVIYSLSEFNEPYSILGNLHYLKNNSNLHSKIPNIDVILSFENMFIEEIIIRNNCIRSDGLYLCNGNYYQDEFLQLLELLNNDDDCEIITNILFKKIGEIDNDISFIAITSSSHKILNSLIKQNLIKRDKCIFLDSYVNFHQDPNINLITKDNRYYLFGDVISGGSMVKKLDAIIKNKGATLEKLIFLVNTIDEDFENSQEFLDENKNRIVYAHRYKIRKFRKDKIDKKEKFNSLIRINPYTNLPILFSEKHTVTESILLDNKSFLDYMDDDDMVLNFTIFNNNVHPYFFNLKKILQQQNLKIEANEINLISDLVDKLDLTINSNFEIFYPKNSDIENLNFDILKSNVFKNHSIGINSLDRFNINAGWKFPHTTDRYELIVKDKDILIVDDGSSSGDSILQMINELSHFQPKKITLLCLLGKITSHKREFYARIKSMKHRSDEEGEVLIDIKFGCNWNLPYFSVNDSPYSIEINWLKDLKKNKYLPQYLKNINELVLEIVSPKEDHTSDYKFFIKDKEGKFLKKELLLVRNEIGKIIGYRFYLESFVWFNNFMAKYEERIFTPDRTKDIELLCMCLLYEPYIYKRMASIMPDIREKIEEFVQKILLADTVRIGLDYLFFDWKNNIKDLIHLFFIVYDNENITKILTVQGVNKIIEFIIKYDDSISTINYFFFKILYYYPLSTDDVRNKKYSSHFTNVISAIIESKNQTDLVSKYIKRFKSFVSTLPTDNDFNSKKNEIKEFYRKIKDNVHHRDSITAIYDILMTNLKVLKLDESVLGEVKNGWDEINRFMEIFISFENTFPYFFLDGLNNFSEKENIQSIQTEISDIFLQDKDIIISIDAVEERLNSFHKNYLKSESSIYYKIFNYTTTDVSKEMIQQIFQEKCSTLNIQLKLEFSKNFKGDILLDFPKFYFKEYIIEEICKNFRHSKGVIKIIVNYEEQCFILEVVNDKNTLTKEGGGNGLLKLENLRHFPEEIVEYQYKDENNTFTQKLKIKTI